MTQSYAKYLGELLALHIRVARRKLAVVDGQRAVYVNDRLIGWTPVQESETDMEMARR